MGTFCFDQYDHPLLWCEEKKRLVERQNAQESVRMWQRKKAEETALKEKEKKEYHELAMSHCPWGRPGGGAPNLDIRKRNITAEGLHPTPKYGARGSSLPPCHLNMGSSGHIRSAADRLYITLKDHPSVSFRNKGHVDIELRYKQQNEKKPPNMQLEKITVTEKVKPKDKKKSTADEVHDPWGRPGPGGRPWRNPKSVGSSFMRSLGWTNKELLKELDQENPQTTPSEKPKKKSKAAIEIVRKCCPMCSCKCATMTTSESEPIVSSEKLHSKEGNGKELTPLQNKSGEMPRKVGRDRERKEKPTRVKRVAAAAAAGAVACHRKSCAANVQNEGVELVPLLARRRGMHRPVSLSSTDVTKRTECNRSPNQYDVQYLNDLKRQMKQNYHRMKLFKEREVELCARHFRTFEQFWGRPGHGAPRDIKTKLNLDDLLYGVSVD